MIRPFLLVALIPLIGAAPTIRAQATFSAQDDEQIRRLLQDARDRQLLTTNQFRVFHGFRFTDRVTESGISFVHHMTDDSGRAEKAVHYDHGSGVATADVDGDDRLDLYFVNQINGNQLWRNLGGGRFENITDSAGVAVGDRVSVAAAFADLDNDGDADLVVSAVRSGNLLFENLGHGKFREVSTSAGLTARWHSSGIVILDYNLDRLPDILVTSVGRFTTDQRGPGGYYVGFTNAFSGHLFPERSEPTLLYRNEGGLRFTEVATAAGVARAGWSGDASACDFNLDGFPDLYLLNMQGDDHFFVNEAGNRFVDQTGLYFPKTPWGAMGIAVFDYNRDGRFDVLITDMHSDMTGGQGRLRRDFNSDIERAKSEAWCTAQWDDAFLQGASNNIFGNAFYHNEGNGRWTEVSDAAGIENYWPWGVSIGDLNADGYEDVLITSGMGYPFAYGVNSLLLNDRGERFRSAEFLLGIEPRREQRVSKPCFTLDCDGADRNHPLCRGRTGSLQVYSSLSTRSAIIADFDDDGDLDIVTNEFDDAPQVLWSNLSDLRPPRYLKVRLVGTRSNRDGLGATVTMNAGGASQVRYHTGKSGYLAQSRLPLYFGLDQETRVESVEVRWPSGRRQLITDAIPTQGLLVITEPGESPPPTGR